MVQDLGLQVDPSDENAIKAEIRKQLSALHPDRNNGQFSSENSRERFDKLTKALDYLEQWKKDSQALIPVNQVYALVQSINDALAPSAKTKLDSIKNECVANHKRETKARYRLPRFSSGVFAGLCGIIITFAGQLKEHPLFSQLLKFGFSGSRQYYEFEERMSENRPNEIPSELFKNALDSYVNQRLNFYLYILLILFICSGILFILTWMFERKAEARGEWLLSEDGLRYIFERVLQKNSINRKVQDQIQFTKRDLVSEITKKYKRRRRLPFQNEYKISPSLADKIATFYIEQLEYQNIAKKTASPRLDPIYETRIEVLDDLRLANGDRA